MENAINKVLEAMRADYKRWSMSTRTVHQNVDDFNREMDIRNKMIVEYCEGLKVKEGSRYWKITGSNGSGSQVSVKGFIVKAGDKKFREGDMLKAAGWAAPARNFARGNVLDWDFDYPNPNIQWTGIG
jgi:hypothetical protein